MAEYALTCPPCGQRLSAASDAELIRTVQAHARAEHAMELSAEDVRAKMAAQGKAPTP